VTQSWKSFVVVGCVVTVALVFATAALAGFVPQAKLLGPAGAGWESRMKSAAWSGTLSALYPGSANDVEYIAFAVTNSGHANRDLRSITASVRTAPDGDAETASGADISGCRTSWFTVAVDRRDDPLPAEVRSARSYNGRVDLSMRDSGSNQDACEDASPAVTVSAG
jgi:hypothetical protein